jgi:hypothetical protein
MPLQPKPEYHPTLVKFMSYRDNEQYERDHEFTPEELNEIQPEEIENSLRKLKNGKNTVATQTYESRSLLDVVEAH